MARVWCGGANLPAGPWWGQGVGWGGGAADTGAVRGYTAPCPAAPVAPHSAVARLWHWCNVTLKATLHHGNEELNDMPAATRIRDIARTHAPPRLPVLAAAVAVTAFPDHAAPQNRPPGVLLSPRVVCRAAPSHSAGAAKVLVQRGNVSHELVSVGDTASDGTGGKWVSVDRRHRGGDGSCWVPEALVAPYSGSDELLAIADRLLAAPEGYGLEDWVAVHNYFLHPPYRQAVEGSAVLSLRRLELLMRAVELARSRWTGNPDPRVAAWFESLGGQVEYVPDQWGGGRWAVSRELLDSLHEAHRTDPIAEEILWKSARYTGGRGGCPGSLECLFDLTLRTVSRYWLAYPDGAYVSEAVRTALGRIASLDVAFAGAGILETCERARDSGPDAWEVEAWDRLEWESRGVPGARRLRASLDDVAGGVRAPLVDFLDRVERCAIEVGARRPGGPESGAGKPPPGEVGGGDAGQPGETRELAIIVPGVACRREPSRTATGYAVRRLGRHFTTGGPDTIVAGEAWVSASRWSPCWIPRSETAPAGGDGHLLAIADRFLASGTGRTLDHALRVYNVLAGRHRGHRDAVDSSAVLTLRRLQVLGEVLKTVGPFDADALTRGWATQLEDEVWLWSIGGRWYVRDEAFLDAYERHRDTPWAEEILWAFATGPAPHDCEGDFSCTARVEVKEKLVPYWTGFPHGEHVSRAVGMAVVRLGGFLETCRAALGVQPGSRAANLWRWARWEPRGAETAREIRATLSALRPRDSEPLVNLFDGLEECAEEVGRVR